MAGDEPDELECKEAKKLSHFDGLITDGQTFHFLQKKYRIEHDKPIDYYVIMKKSLKDGETAVYYWIYDISKKELIPAGGGGSGFNVSPDRKTIYFGGWGATTKFGVVRGYKADYDEKRNWNFSGAKLWFTSLTAKRGTAPDSSGNIKTVAFVSGQYYTYISVISKPVTRQTWD